MERLRVAVFHNRYLHRGGEDTAVDTEVRLLQEAGHEVRTCFVDNRDEIGGRTGGALRAAARARWNPESERRVAAMLRSGPIDVAHVHNFFPVFSGALHTALHRRGVPVVQTLHNYRLACGNGFLLRDGRVCEDCVGNRAWNAVRHGCYRGSRLQTAVWAEATQLHRRLGTWDTRVDRYALPTAFARDRLVATGVDPTRADVVPYVVEDPGPPSPPGTGAAYIGRLSPEKGVDLLIDAWRSLDAPLWIAGDGPAHEALRERAKSLGHVQLLGRRSRDEVKELLRRVAFVVVPSRWYEISPFAAVEALAAGRPVVAWDGGAMRELIGDGGVLYSACAPDAVAGACRRLLESRETLLACGTAARKRYLERHAPARGRERLEGLYRAAMQQRRAAARPSEDRAEAAT
ncbi:MAG: glycosyltransferase family 4 protein [Myxococcota bacterium]